MLPAQRLLLWGLVRHVGGRTAALATLAIYLFSPFSLLWSRSSLIEHVPWPAPWDGCGPDCSGAHRLLAGLLGTWIGAMVILNPAYSRLAYQSFEVGDACYLKPVRWPK